MPLTDRPDFQAWLDRFDALHADVARDGLEPPAGRCDGCGAPVAERLSKASLCLVCLAEHFGREQAAAAARVASALLPPLAADPGTPTDVIRAAVDEVLDEHELAFDRC